MNVLTFSQSMLAQAVSFTPVFTPISVASLASTISLASVGIGATLALFPAVVWAEQPGDRIQQPQVLAQRIVDGLPPPPLDSTGDYIAPGSFDQPISPAIAAPAAAPAQSLYMVVVNGDSPLLLSQVQQVEPNAQVQPYKGQAVIQAGVFSEEQGAVQQVQALTAQGIAAAIVSVSSELYATSDYQPASYAATPEPFTTAPLPDAYSSNEVVFGQYPDLQNPALQPTGDRLSYASPRNSPYYVVIPATVSELDFVSNQVLLLGQGVSMAGIVQARDQPLGSHVRVGPFVDQAAAERWSGYLRDFGMNARVYYQQ